MRPTSYPAVDDITMVNPTKITDLGVYVKLLEYNNIEGLIMLSDLSKSRFRSINKVVSIGKKFPACVHTIDEKTKYITLSKKDVSNEEQKECEETYSILKFINDLVILFTKRTKREHNISISINDAYHIFIWSISHDPKFLMYSLKTAAKNFDKVYDNKLDNIDPKLIACFQQVLLLKFKEKDIFLEAVLEITCFETGGINIIKSVLLDACNMATTEYPFKLKLIKSPYYSITLKTNKQEEAVKLINNTIEKIKLGLENNGANIKIIKKPEIILNKEFDPENFVSEYDQF